MSLSEFKAEFRNREGIHFNNAGLAPISIRVANRVSEVLTDLSRHGSFADKLFIPGLKDTRERLARFLGADPTEIAYFQNCASALSQIAFSLKLAPSDSVVVLGQEYSSNFYPWRVACERAQAKLIVIKSGLNEALNLDALKLAIVPGVKCVAISWVQFQTGAIVDLKWLGTLCHHMGAKLVVDGIQGIGQLPISFRDLPIDALAGASHKWLCGLTGQGFLVVKKEWLSALDPLVVGSGTFNRIGTTSDPSAQMELSARKFEPGGHSFISLFALDAAIELQEAVGKEVIQDEITHLSLRMRNGLLELEERGVALATPIKQLGGITSFMVSPEAELNFLSRAREEKIAVMKRGPFLRASIHAFNNDGEVDQVLRLIREIL